MNIKYYINLKCDRSNPVEISKFFNILHGTFRKLNKYYPISLPLKNMEYDFKSIRIFAETKEELLNLISNIHSLDFSNIEDIPEVNEYISFQRYKIPNRNEKYNKRVIKMRHSMNMYHFNTKHGRQNINIIKSNVKNTNNCEPNSYGLSVASRPFNLPNF